jgi:hypothetical protein
MCSSRLNAGGGVAPLSFDERSGGLCRLMPASNSRLISSTIMIADSPQILYSP